VTIVTVKEKELYQCNGVFETLNMYLTKIHNEEFKTAKELQIHMIAMLEKVHERMTGLEKELGFSTEIN
jgi:pimeloyl-CoA synthetase